MNFISFEFILLASISFFIYYFISSSKWRLYWIVACSLLFYLKAGIFPILLLTAVVLGNFLAARFIAAAPRPKKGFFIAAVLANVLVLAFFKYFNSVSSLGAFATQAGNAAGISLPLGMSFYIFTLIGYLVDVYRRQAPGEQNLARFSSFILFFPKLAQGPIERAGRLLPQFQRAEPFSESGASDGLKQIVWGIFKKVVIADRLGVYVNQVYGSPRDYSGIPLLVATFFFAFQIYADFSGYTDIALGGARLFGIRLSPNFRRPYLSRSIKEFWTRWHISLSTWLRDYLHMPIAFALSRRMPGAKHLGVQTEKWIYLISTGLTFFVCGIWHGVGWNFVVWGMLFGVYLVFSSWSRKARKKVNRALHLRRLPNVHRLVSVLFTFCLVCLAWIFFRAQSLGDAGYVVSHLFSGLDRVFQLQSVEDILMLFRVKVKRELLEIFISFLLILFLIILEWIQERKPLRLFLRKQPIWVHWAVYQVFVLAIIFFGVFKQTSFIYFNF